jgi:hypothetical protein
MDRYLRIRCALLCSSIPGGQLPYHPVEEQGHALHARGGVSGRALRGGHERGRGTGQRHVLWQMLRFEQGACGTCKRRVRADGSSCTPSVSAQDLACLGLAQLAVAGLARGGGRVRLVGPARAVSVDHGHAPRRLARSFSSLATRDRSMCVTGNIA